MSYTIKGGFSTANPEEALEKIKKAMGNKFPLGKTKLKKVKKVK